MKSEFKGDILKIRALEDCIRAAKKYTKGAFSRSQYQETPIQGGEFPSKLLTEYYEVYPEMEISWNMPASSAIDWLWGDTTRIDVRFQYDYRQDIAKMIVFGGPRSIQELSRGINGFQEALLSSIGDTQANAKKQGASHAGIKSDPEKVVDSNIGTGSCFTPHP